MFGLDCRFGRPLCQHAARLLTCWYGFARVRLFSVGCAPGSRLEDSGTGDLLKLAWKDLVTGPASITKAAHCLTYSCCWSGASVDESPLAWAMT